MNGQTQTISLPKKNLEIFIRQTIKDSIREEIMKLRAVFLPYVSDKEQEDIEKLYGKPSRKIEKSYNLDV